MKKRLIKKAIVPVILFLSLFSLTGIGHGFWLFNENKKADNGMNISISTNYDIGKIVINNSETDYESSEQNKNYLVADFTQISYVFPYYVHYVCDDTYIPTSGRLIFGVDISVTSTAQTATYEDSNGSKTSTLTFGGFVNAFYYPAKTSNPSKKFNEKESYDSSMNCVTTFSNGYWRETIDLAYESVENFTFPYYDVAFKIGSMFNTSDIDNENLAILKAACLKMYASSTINVTYSVRYEA